MPQIKQVLFVDDEIKVLQGIRRLLHTLRKDWNMFFVTSGKEALQLLQQSDFDIIVTDMRMPTMNGPELLNAVRDHYPHIVRIVLSGQSDQDAILKAISPAHQFLAKPCNFESIKSVLDRAMDLRQILLDKQLKEIVSGLESLPSLSQNYYDLVEELEAPDISLRNVEQIVSRDLGLTSKILKVVNSSFFGLPRLIGSPEEAVRYLGLNIIKALLLSTRIYEQFEERSSALLDLEDLQQHSTTVALAAKKIVGDYCDDQRMVGDALLAGLLHDVGKLIMADSFPKAYKEIGSIAVRHEISFYRAERIRLGASHAELGAYLLGLWGLSDTIVQAVAHHHNPSAASPQEFNALTALHVANSFVRMSAAPTAEDQTGPLDRDYLRGLDLLDRLQHWWAICHQSGQKK